MLFFLRKLHNCKCKNIVKNNHLPCVYRVVDPHGHVIVNRRRTTSGSSRDHHNHGHHMGALAEDPAEEDQMNDDETDSVSNGSTGGNYLLGIS